MKPRRYRQPSGKYLEHTITVQVRFQEVDALRIVWHGHYLSYFEDARTALGSRYGVGYEDMLEAGVVAPIVHASCDYVQPARFGDTLAVTARLFAREAAKLEFFYLVTRAADGVLLATGQTIQSFTTLEGELILTQPPLMRRLYEQWESHMQSTGDTA